MSDYYAGQTGAPMLHITIPDLKTLAALYLSFPEGGGLFLPGSDLNALGEPVVVIMKLLKPARRFALVASIFLVMPDKARSRYPAGVGLKFSGGDTDPRVVQEKLLAPFHAKTSAHTKTSASLPLFG